MHSSRMHTARTSSHPRGVSTPSQSRHPQEQIPQEQTPRQQTPPEQAPPGQISLNFPLGCGPGDPPSQTTFAGGNYLFEHINSLQYYELTGKCSLLPLMLASPLTYAVHLWSAHCKYAMKQN